ncbi:hypothetical protein [Stutzerimonas stutzeri]|uniref:Cation/multidrug efflux pump n=1 Tax=Stutzerimonas stutzeri TaxID=316 RepID=A0A6I6LQG3_STUST|nr:hypothetical protein [Stutzerimonas stutzeri]QGZ31553.1 hypothetical protein GQA94_16335 [Stutzerimonas stutzeri]
MQYLGLAVVVALLALITSLIAVRMLSSGDWLLGWLRGTVGMLVLALGGLIGLIAWDATTYRPLVQSTPLASLSFKADGQQRYQVTVEEGHDIRFVTLEGDLWQLDMRALEWKGLAALIGLKPGYRLEKLSGRYLAVEQQEQARRPYVELGRSRAGVDFWAWLQRCQCTSLMIEAQPRRVSYLPIADGAEYKVAMTPAGLMAKPANEAAEQAMRDW